MRLAMVERSAVFRASRESGFGASCDSPGGSRARSFARAVSQGATRDIGHSSTRDSPGTADIREWRLAMAREQRTFESGHSSTRDSPGTADIESTARAEIVLSRRCRSLEEIGVRIVLFSVAAGTVGGPALIATVARVQVW